MRFQGFIGPSYTLQSVNVDCQRSVNLFPEKDALGTGKEGEVASLVPTPGLRLLATLPAVPFRGAWTCSANGILYVVAGGYFYSVASDYTYTQLGALQTTSGPVSMADNGQHVVMVDGTYGYYLTLADGTFTQISDPAFYPCDQVAFLDGYFIFNRSGTQQFFISGLYAMTFDALDFASAEGKPDNLIGLITTPQNIYLFGSQSTEVFYDSGAAAFPFERIQGAINDVGCAAAFTIQLIQNNIYFLGGDSTGTGIVYKMQGYQAERISTPAIEAVIRGLDQTTLSTARAWSYSQGGHSFYCLNLPGHDATFCYDASTGLWHERTYLNLWSLERHRAEVHALAYGKNIVGDYETGALYQLDPDTLTDNGTSIARIRTAPHLSQGMVRNFHHSFQLDMEVGVGTSTGQGQTPQAMLRWSDDGGHSWSNEHWADIGAIGNTKTRVIWRRLGSSRDRVYEIRITDPVKCVLIGAELAIEPGAA